MRLNDRSEGFVGIGRSENIALETIAQITNENPDRPKSQFQWRLVFSLFKEVRRSGSISITVQLFKLSLPRELAFPNPIHLMLHYDALDELQVQEYRAYL